MHAYHEGRSADERIMRSMDRQLILDLKEITSIGIQCSKCGARTILDLTNQNCATPNTCSPCGSQFYKDSREGETPLDRLVQALRVQTSKHVITLHLPIAPVQV